MIKKIISFIWKQKKPLGIILLTLILAVVVFVIYKKIENVLLVIFGGSLFSIGSTFKKKHKQKIIDIQKEKEEKDEKISNYSYDDTFDAHIELARKRRKKQ